MERAWKTGILGYITVYEINYCESNRYCNMRPKDITCGYTSFAFLWECCRYPWGGGAASAWNTSACSSLNGRYVICHDISISLLEPLTCNLDKDDRYPHQTKQREGMRMHSFPQDTLGLKYGIFSWWPVTRHIIAFCYTTSIGLYYRRCNLHSNICIANLQVVVKESWK